MQSHGNLLALRTAVPYIRAYKGRVFVVKLGGRLCEPGPVLDNLVDQLALLYQLGVKLVVVHGGGDQMNALSERLGLRQEIVAGRRVTNAETLELAKMTFAGTVNTNLVAAFRRFHVPAVGLSGADGGLITVKKRPAAAVTDPSTGQTREVDYGFVGDIVSVRTDVVEHLLSIDADRPDDGVTAQTAGGGYVPVVGSLATDVAGQIYNINADTLASRVAVALRAAKYFLLTTVDGVLRDLSDPSTLHSYLDLDQLDELTRAGAISGGMLPKLAACRDALLGGVPRVHIVNGTTPDGLLGEVFTNEGSGTLIVAKRNSNSDA